MGSVPITPARSINAIRDPQPSLLEADSDDDEIPENHPLGHSIAASARSTTAAFLNALTAVSATTVPSVLNTPGRTGLVTPRFGARTPVQGGGSLLGTPNFVLAPGTPTEVSYKPLALDQVPINLDPDASSNASSALLTPSLDNALQLVAPGSAAVDLGANPISAAVVVTDEQREADLAVAQAAAQAEAHPKMAPSRNLNIRAALVHVLGDIVQTIGVMIAAGIIWKWPKARIADPICTFFFSILVIITTFGVCRDAFALILQTSPPHINLDDVVHTVLEVPYVAQVHDLHLWMLTFSKSIGSMHVVMTHDAPRDALGLHNLRRAIQAALRRRFGLHHVTIQLEMMEETHHDVICEHIARKDV